MYGDQDVAGDAFQKGETLFKILKRVRILATIRELEWRGGYRRQTVGIDHIVANIAIAGSPGPTRAAGSVSWSKVCG